MKILELTQFKRIGNKYKVWFKYERDGNVYELSVILADINIDTVAFTVNFKRTIEEKFREDVTLDHDVIVHARSNKSYLDIISKEIDDSYIDNNAFINSKYYISIIMKLHDVKFNEVYFVVKNDYAVVKYDATYKDERFSRTIKIDDMDYYHIKIWQAIIDSVLMTVVNGIVIKHLASIFIDDILIDRIKNATVRPTSAQAYELLYSVEPVESIGRYLALKDITK